MRTIAFLSAVLVATPALAGPCIPPMSGRYVAPPESIYSGSSITLGWEDPFSEDHYVGDDHEPLSDLYRTERCSMGVCYILKETNEFSFAVMERDERSALIRMHNEPALRWQADCQ